MTDLRRSRESDLLIVASWIGSERECRLWCGTRVSYPIDPLVLPDAISFQACESWSVVVDAGMVAFGQLVPKQAGRLHLARLIVEPGSRRAGHGRLIVRHLLDTALTRSAPVVSLNVSRDNLGALSLYRSMGFAEASRPPDEDESDSIYMEYAAAGRSPPKKP